MPLVPGNRLSYVLLTSMILVVGCGKKQSGTNVIDRLLNENSEFIVDSNLHSATDSELRSLTETTLSCFSAGGKRTYCGYSKRLVKAKVLERYSAASCGAGVGFGIDAASGTLWVDRGCRAKFSIFFPAATSWQNSNRYDVNDDGLVNEKDREELIAELNRRDALQISSELGERPSQQLGAFWDVDNDNRISPKDVLEFDNYIKMQKCPSGTVEDKGTCLLVKPFVNGLPWYSSKLCEQYGLTLAYQMDKADCEATAKNKVNLFGYPTLGTCAAAVDYRSPIQYFIARCSMSR